MVAMFIDTVISQDYVMTKTQKGYLNSYLTNSKTNTNNSICWELSTYQHYYLNVLHV